MLFIQLIFGIALIVVVVRQLKLKPKDTKVKFEYPPISKEQSEDFVQKLESYGYFEHAEIQNTELLKKKMIDALVEQRMLATEYTNDRKFTPLDFRLFILDNEALYEEGGFLDAINNMQPLFDKINFKIDISNHTEEVDDTNTWIDHKVTVNEKEYIIFENYKGGYGWGEAAQRFAEIINDQLQLQSKEDRIYLINGEEAIFLNDNQFKVIDDFLKDKSYKPLKVEDWCKQFKVDPTNYKQTRT